MDIILHAPYGTSGTRMKHLHGEGGWRVGASWGPCLLQRRRVHDARDIPGRRKLQLLCVPRAQRELALQRIDSRLEAREGVLQDRVRKGMAGELPELGVGGTSEAGGVSLPPGGGGQVGTQ